MGVAAAVECLAHKVTEQRGQYSEYNTHNGILGGNSCQSRNQRNVMGCRHGKAGLGKHQGNGCYSEAEYGIAAYGSC